MITQSEARALAQSRVDAGTKIECQIIDSATQDLDWAWMFFYNSREWVETGRIESTLAGNGPLVVEKGSGKIHELRTAFPIDTQLADLRKRSGY
jgi:hypothetical protein